MKIAIGIATKIGMIGSAAGIVVPFIGELADTTAPLGIPSSVWFIVGAALAGVTVIGRMAQAVAVFLRGDSGEGPTI